MRAPAALPSTLDRRPSTVDASRFPVHNLPVRPPALLLLALLGCSGTEAKLKALTYNVAGLPEGISHSHPLEYTPLISPLLEPYDLVLVQEDFTYHDALVSKVTHPHRSVPQEPVSKLTGDGLNLLARTPFEDLIREPWATCNGMLDSGSDCLAEKGILSARFRFAERLPVDIYDIHADAGGDPDDIAARSAQIDQLLALLARRSSGSAVIIAGDTNLRLTRPEDVVTLERLKAQAGLTDACLALHCEDESHIDRFLYRSGGGVHVETSTWAVDRRFVTAAGDDLSDHPAVSVGFVLRSE